MAAISENYSGGSFLSDLVARPEFLQYTSEGIFEQSKWIQSGVVQRNAALDARAGGTRGRVPFHDPINPTEEQILSNATWGTGGAGYLPPQGTSADEQIMTLLHRGFSYAADDLSKLGSELTPRSRPQPADRSDQQAEDRHPEGSTAGSVRWHHRCWRPWR